MSEPYRPAEFWQDRLSENFNLRGVGHGSHDEAYNRWLYARKRAALKDALAGRPAGTRALDIGSGVGWVVSYLLGRGFQVTGCDIAQVSVDRLTSQFPEVDFFKLAVGSEPIPRDNDIFDVVTMMDVAYHIVDDDLWNTALREFARVLLPGGQIVITDGLTDETLRQGEHVKKRSFNDWNNAAHNAGLRLARTGPYFRWLSRPHPGRQWGLLPDGLRGALEFGLEYTAPVRPHMQWATLVHA